MSNALEDSKFRERMRLIGSSSLNRKELESLDRQLDKRVTDAANRLGDEYTFQEGVDLDNTRIVPEVLEKEPPGALVERRRRPNGAWEPFAFHRHKAAKYAEAALRRGKTDKKYEYRVRTVDLALDPIDATKIDADPNA